MEIISRCHYEVLQKTEVIQFVWIATLTLAMTIVWIAMPTSRLAHAMRLSAMTGTNYFLAMIMAENLFLILGIILITAFYLIEKLIQQKKIYFKERKDEKDFSNGYSIIDYGNDTSFWDVWS